MAANHTRVMMMYLMCVFLLLFFLGGGGGGGGGLEYYKLCLFMSLFLSHVKNLFWIVFVLSWVNCVTAHLLEKFQTCGGGFTVVFFFHLFLYFGGRCCCFLLLLGIVFIAYENTLSYVSFF